MNKLSNLRLIGDGFHINKMDAVKFATGTSLISFGIATATNLISPDINLTNSGGSLFGLLTEANRIVDSNVLGHIVLSLSNWITTTAADIIPLLSDRSSPETVQLAEFIPRAYALITGIRGVYGTLVSRSNRMEQGIEPLRTWETPDQVILGDAGLVTDFARTVSDRTPHSNQLLKNPFKGENIGVILGDLPIGQRPPSAFKTHLKYYFNQPDVSKLLDSVGREQRPFSMIQATGIDRARILTFICYNMNHAIGYGLDSSPNLDPTDVSTVLMMIPPEKLNGKIINVFLSDEALITSGLTVKQELLSIQDDFAKKGVHFELNIVTAKEFMVQELQTALDQRAKVTTSSNETILALVGQGNTSTDSKMLDRLGVILAHLKVSENKPIKVLIKKTSGTYVLTLKRKSNETEELIPEIQQIDDNEFLNMAEKVTLTVCYGDKDSGTSSLVTVCQKLGLNLKDIYAIVESPLSKEDFARRNVNVIELYEYFLSQYLKILNPKNNTEV